jgi:pyruvate dehydrogenase E2 component (dihydrolipoamide acetyltransferase)
MSNEPVRQPLSRMRKAIARAMVTSAAIPQFTIEVDADLTALADFRNSLEPGLERFSYSDVFTAACAHTLAEHPRMNSSFIEDSIVEHTEINVGIAISIDDGLVAPAIGDANHRDLGDLATARVQLSEAAVQGKLTPHDLMSSTFTISNLGPFGIRRFRALVVPPQAAIVGIGASTPDQRCSLSLSCDHRLLDGAPAARFLTNLVGRLEEPKWLTPLLPHEHSER